MKLAFTQQFGQTVNVSDVEMLSDQLSADWDVTLSLMLHIMIALPSHHCQNNSATCD